MRIGATIAFGCTLLLCCGTDPSDRAATLIRLENLSARILRHEPGTPVDIQAIRAKSYDKTDGKRYALVGPRLHLGKPLLLDERERERRRQTQAAIDRVVERQLPDGGWGDVRQGPGRVGERVESSTPSRPNEPRGRVTATAVAVLALLCRGEESSITETRIAARRGVRWLIARQEDDGGFGGIFELRLADAVAATALLEARGIGLDEEDVISSAAARALNYVIEASLATACTRGGVLRLRPDEALALAWTVQAVANAMISSDDENPIRATRVLRLGAALADYETISREGRARADSRSHLRDEIQSGGWIARLFLLANGDGEFGHAVIPSGLIEGADTHVAGAPPILRASLEYHATGGDRIGARWVEVHESEVEGVARATEGPLDTECFPYGPAPHLASRALIMQTSRRHYRWFNDIGKASGE